MKKIRKIISLLLLYSLIIEAVSGIILFISPLDRIGDALQWQVFGLDKPAWDDVHTLFGFILMLSGLAHLILNGRVITGYIRCHLKKCLSGHFVAASLVIVLLFVATLMRWQPIDYLLGWGEDIRRSWARQMVMEQMGDIPPQMREMMLRRFQQRDVQ